MPLPCDCGISWSYSLSILDDPVLIVSPIACVLFLLLFLFFSLFCNAVLDVLSSFANTALRRR